MQFSFATAGEILFGPGMLETAVARMAALGKRFLVVTGSNSERAGPLLRSMMAQKLEASLFSVPMEPSLSIVEKGASAALQAECQVVVGMGGGSAMDAAKAIAALMTNREGVLEYVEVIGKGRPLQYDAAPCVAIPTTAGTGAEVTRNAVLVSSRHKVKVSLRHASMLPRLAVVDPLLTHGMSPEVTASTGLDALTQLMEAWLSRKATPLTDGFCLEGLVRASQALPRAYADGNDAEAREEMHLASLLSGLALANGGLGMVHGLAAPLGGLLGAPHGMVCAVLLPAALRANTRLAREHNAQEPLRRLQELAVIVTGNVHAGLEDGVRWVEELCASLQVQGLAALGLQEEDVDKVAEQGLRASSMKGNPLEPSATDLSKVLREAM